MRFLNGADSLASRFSNGCKGHPVSDPSGKLKYALYGGVVTAATIGLPGLNLLNCFCCAGVLLGGFLSIFFWTRDIAQGLPPPTTAAAIQLGALSGVFGALIGSFLNVIMILSLGDIVKNMLSSQMEPGGMFEALPPQLISAFDEMLSGEGSFSIVDIIAPLIVWLLVGPLFGMLGALMGFAVFRPKVTVPHPSVSQSLTQLPPNPPGES